MNRLAIFSGLALFACSGPSHAPARQLESPFLGQTSAPPPSPADAAIVTRVGLTEEAAVEQLPIHLVPSRDRASCLIVSDDPDHRRSYVRRIGTEGVGEIHVIDGRHVVHGIDLPEGPRVVTSDGGSVCIEGFDDAPPRCHDIEVSFVVALGGEHLALVEERRVGDARDLEEGRGPSKQREDGDPEDVEAPEVSVWIHPLTADGAPDGEPIDSGLRFERPLEGMGIIDALGTPRGAVLLFYEQARPRLENEREVARAKLRTVQLDEAGAAGAVRTVFEGDRRYGYIDGHHRQRLYRFESSVVVVGRRVDPKASPRARFEAHRLDGRAVSAPTAVFALDPDRLGTTVDATSLARSTALFDMAPRIVPGQPGSDAGRIAWVESKGWFLVDGELHATTNDAPERAAGISARRSRVRWAHLEATGAGLVATSDGLVRIEPDGSFVRAASSSFDLAGAPARTSDGYWAIRRASNETGARLVRLWPTPLDGPAVVAGETVLASGGLLFRRRGGVLAVERFADGVALELARHASPFRGHFLGVGTASGALLAGERGGQIVAVAVDETGNLTRSIALGEGDVVALEARSDGAVLTTERRLIWLDALGQAIAQAPRPPPAATPPCVDGRPLPSEIPLGPGVLQPIPAPPDACVSSEIVAFADGSLRWVGSRVRGADSEAELVTIAPPLHLATAVASRPPAQPLELGAAFEESPCPAEMVSVGGAFCIDRYESRLAGGDGSLLSPDYPLSPGLITAIFNAWSFGRFYEGDVRARAQPLPALARDPAEAPRFVARSERGVAPSGFLSGFAARDACAAAGKRLCRHEEWVRACRGENQTKFPYGDDYEHGACNVFRFDHPARLLHGNAAVGHLDPRLNRVAAADGPMRHDTGQRPRCASRWGDDAIYDMVGNLDEWLDDRKGAFAGGFYARATRSGCDALITVHPRRYLDYSLGVRCCQSAAP